MDKIIGIGNALVDILAVIEDDALLESMNLPKGSMQLIGKDTLLKIQDLFSRMEDTLCNGRFCRKHDQCFGSSGSSSGIYR